MTYRNMQSPQINEFIEMGLIKTKRNILFYSEIRNSVINQLEKKRNIKVFDAASSCDEFLITFEHKGETIQLSGKVLEKVEPLEIFQRYKSKFL
jgi:hypothetical protein